MEKTSLLPKINRNTTFKPNTIRINGSWFRNGRKSYGGPAAMIWRKRIMQGVNNLPELIQSKNISTSIQLFQ
jgi:hypothetical protein